ncbi:MAG: SCO family protein [candidate division WOR-3 bacterium]
MRLFFIFGLLSGSCSYKYNGMLLEKPIEINQDFILIDHNGNLVEFKSLLEKYNLIYFGYTLCPDVCYSALKDISEALKYIKKDVKVLFISVDIHRDKPEILKQYLKNFNKHFIGLVPKDENELYKITKFFSIAYQFNENGYIAHSSFIIFIKDNKIIGYFPLGLKPKEIANDLNRF